MAPQRDKADNRSVHLPKASSSKLPSPLKFPLVILLSFSASFFLLSFASVLTRLELSTVSRSVNDVWVVLAFPLWRIVELGVGWFGGFDDYDMAAMTLQTRLPYFYFLSTFYDISLSTSAICLTLDVISATIPFSLLRRRIPAHSLSTNAPIRNRSVVNDWIILGLTTVLGAAVYGLALLVSFRTWLPVHIVTHFDGVRSIQKVHETGLGSLIVTFLPLGWAARTFFFSPSTTAQRSLDELVAAPFDPETASLGSTIQHNIWGWSKGTKVVILRSLPLAVLIGMTTWIRVWGTIEGSESYGAAGWASIWAVASLLNGAVLGWVGHV